MAGSMDVQPMALNTRLHHDSHVLSNPPSLCILHFKQQTYFMEEETWKTG